MSKKSQRQIQLEKNKIRAKKSIWFFNLGFVFVKIEFLGTLLVAFVVATILQIPEEKAIRLVFLFSLPIAICVCLCFIISDILRKGWLMALFWTYGAISITYVLINEVIIKILQ